MEYTGLEQQESHSRESRLSRRSWWTRSSTKTRCRQKLRSKTDEKGKQNHTYADKIRRFNRRWITEALKNAKEDVKTTQWKSLLWPICCHLFALSTVTSILAGFLVLATGTIFNLNSPCMPDGAFGAAYEYYDIWSLGGIFEITLGFGELPFSTVKVIDVLWNVCVGRGGQAVLVYLSYQVFTKALMRSMEHSPVSYGTFEAITLQHGSLTAMMKLVQNFMLNKGLRAKAAIAWITISAAFVLAFPTLASAMSGYTANAEAYISIGSDFVGFSQFVVVRYVIHDGWRVGLEGDHLVTSGMTPFLSGSSYAGPVLRLAPIHYDGCLDSPPISNGDGTFDWSGVSLECELQWRISNYVSEYGFFSMNNTASVFNYSQNHYNLDSPTLNIPGYYAPPGPNVSPSYLGNSPWYTFPYASAWINPVTRNVPFQNASNVAYTYYDASTPNSNVNETYSLSYIKDNGSCQPSKTYKWGFSYLSLFIVVLLATIWAIGTYVLWLDAYHNSRIDNTERSMSMQRAVLEISTAMRKDMGEGTSENVSDLELKQMLQRGLHGNQIGYDMLDKRLPLTRGVEIMLWWRSFELITWAHYEKCWIIAWCCSLSLVIASGVFFLWTLFPAALLWLGINISIAAGRNVRSRWLGVVVPPVVGLLLIPALLVPSERQAERQGYLESQILTHICTWTGTSAVMVQGVAYVWGGYLTTLNIDSTDSFATNRDIYFLNLRQGFATTDMDLSAVFTSLPSSQTSYQYWSGTMFANNDTLWSYGGLWSEIGPPLPPNQAVTYQTYPDFHEQRNQSLGNVSDYIAYGAGVNIPSESLGYYFSGMTASDGGPLYFDGNESDSPAIVTESLIQVDTSDSQNPAWVNLTLPPSIAGRVGAQMVWLPVSSQGVLIVIGGLATNLTYTGIGGGFASPSQPADSDNPMFMTQIPVYDIAKETWFLQNTSGGPPSQRIEFCSVVASEHGSSSFEIYIHGGYNGTLAGISTGDIWVLSIPSFVWVLVFEEAGGNTTHCRDSHFCLSPYPDKMLLIGGENGASTDLCVSGLIDVFNLNTLTWLDGYDPTVWSNYSTPLKVASAIEHSPTPDMSLELLATFQQKYEKRIPTYYPYSV